MGSKSVCVGDIYPTKKYGDVEIIHVENQMKVIGRFLNTGYVTKSLQAKSFRDGVTTDRSVSGKIKETNFGDWKVIKELPKRQQPNRTLKRVVRVECVCGEVRDLTLDSLRRGMTTNCGCISKENNPYFHGESSTRLYECWLNMKARSKRRLSEGDSCNVYKDWSKFVNFKKWAIEQGYTDEKILLRGTEEHPDIGDYSPDNCRWGSKSDNYHDWKTKTQLSYSK